MSLDFPNRRNWLAVRSTPRRLPLRRMRTQQFAEGVIHFGSRSAYLEPTAAHSKRRERGLPVTRLRVCADPKDPTKPLLDAKGEYVMADFPIPEPWVRVTDKVKRTGRARRAWLADQRAQA